LPVPPRGRCLDDDGFAGVDDGGVCPLESDPCDRSFLRTSFLADVTVLAAG